MRNKIPTKMDRKNSAPRGRSSFGSLPGVRSVKCAEKIFDFAPNRQKRTAKKIPTKMNGMKSAPKGRSSCGALPGSLFSPYTVLVCLNFALDMNYFRVFCLHLLLTVLIIFRRIVPTTCFHFQDWTRAGIGRKNKLQREKYKATTANGKTSDIPLTNTIIIFFIHCLFGLYLHERSMIFVRTDHSLRSWKLPTLTEKK